MNFDWNVTTNVAKATLSKLGIAVNKRCVSMIGSPERVNVGYDVVNKIIAIKPDDGTSASYGFANRVRNGWVRIGCKHFMGSLGITKSCTVKVESKDGMLLLML